MKNWALKYKNIPPEPVLKPNQVSTGNKTELVYQIILEFWKTLLTYGIKFNRFSEKYIVPKEPENIYWTQETGKCMTN